ncbi:hypothetical protein V2J09_001954 [Rumex salicifolius]
MAPENTNWLSFSLTPMEMLATSQSNYLYSSALTLDSVHHHQQPPTSQHLLENYYANEWERANSKLQNDLCGYMDTQRNQIQTVPKLEDFLGGETTSSLNTQDSSTLSHIYDPEAAASTYFNNAAQEIAPPLRGFQSFPTSSGSEIDDSASVARAEFVGRPIESQNELGFSSQFSLTVVQGGGVEKAIVSPDGDSDGVKKAVGSFGQRTSIYRGVTRHRWTGRYEAHLWDNSCRREGQARKGRQGGYDKEEKAARAYDMAALKYWGSNATTNFPISVYTNEIEEMKHMTKQECIASLKRKSSGFSRGASKYRGVTRHHQQGRWQARIGRVAGNKDLYLGTFATEEEAAQAYDMAAIKFRGVNAVTNFEMNRYNVEALINSSDLVEGPTKRLKLASLELQMPAPSFSHQLPMNEIQYTQLKSSKVKDRDDTIFMKNVSESFGPIGQMGFNYPNYPLITL